MKAKLKSVKTVNGGGKPKLEMAAPTAGLKLDLGCGQSVREGFEGVDLYAKNAKRKINLFKFPWPIETDSCEELHCSHFVEHIPARDIEERDLLLRDIDSGNPTGYNKMVCDRFLGKDMFFAFFEECHRILKKDCWMTVIVPEVKTERAFQDPTHRRFIPMATFLYLCNEWRVLQKLDHYNTTADFGVNMNYSFPKEFELLHQEVQQRKFTEDWNALLDIHAKLKCLKPEKA